MAETQLWEILVPTVSNAGKPFHTRFHRVWDAKVRAITSGLTIMPVAKGQWKAPDGGLFIERMIPVRIACTEEQISRIIDVTMAYYDQLAVMAYCVSEKCIIRSRGDFQINQQAVKSKPRGSVTSASDESAPRSS